MTEYQKTINRSFTVKGKGLHTGLEVELTFKPAPVNHGIKFRRIDLEGSPFVSAIAENVADTSRGTTIQENGIKVITVEHALAALYGMGIDNVQIDIDGAEIPILDGSSRYFAEAIYENGTVDQKEEKNYYCIKEKLEFFDPDTGAEIIAYPDDHFSVNTLISFDSSVLGNQFATLQNISDFKDQFANARTFVFIHELEPLLKKNLIKGGDLENAIVIIDKPISQTELDKLADLFNKPRVNVKPQGILNNIDLLYNNEPARHKLLDLVGDLSLIGMPVKGRFIATRPGHHANTEFARIIRKLIKREQIKAAPHVNLNAKPFLDINQILNILPHRPPFLLIDKILKLDHNSVIGVKNVTMNEQFFVGHFPDSPVMPGVLIIEAMAQVGGIFVLNTISDPENYLPYFLKIDKVKFRKNVIPGDTLVFKLDLLSPIRRGVANMRGQAFVGDTIVTEGEFMAQIVKKTDKD
ncbi:MAG: bifunctional UDP-3-O-[3-hydroxymyristoyl] N-acetylglucosamine deacetylase/3-hydroxyacyl-ACP dehydratase [Bacteroidia bacterium]|nr:bifunctional UDP-3-O-[3-hydroxymyristoyl] N-acetylglucosamine deacetylase/3-hydroxyacyl-ACP dehydratase [Bacteroidia bacterium]